MDVAGTLKGAIQRLNFLVGGLTSAQRTVLSALAMERSLSATQLWRLWGTFDGRPHAVGRGRTGLGSSSDGGLPTWLAECLRSGLLIEAQPMRASGLLQAGQTEAAFALHSDYRQIFLRQQAKQSDLRQAAQTCRQMLGERSLSAFSLVLQTGQLVEFQRYAHALPSLGGMQPEALARALLQEAVCKPFDPLWFEATWGDCALPAAQAILDQAAVRLEDCDALFSWFENAARRPDTELPRHSEAWAVLGCNVTGIRRTLREQALLRGREDLLPTEGAEPQVVAAGQFLRGDLHAAEDAACMLEERQLASSRLLPLLLLLRAGRTRELPGRVSAVSPALEGIGRGLRQLSLALAEPASSELRLDVHQRAAKASAWELLLLGLAVTVSELPSLTRCAWSQRLASVGAEWAACGYYWMGRQAQLIARELAEEFYEQRCAPGLEPTETAKARSGELRLTQLVSAVPAWQRALTALQDIANNAAEEPLASAKRVVWYVDLAARVLSKPGLQLLKPRGWTKGRRLSLSRLREHADELPVEDEAVLRALRGSAEGEGESLGAQWIEALIGHPRVVDAVTQLPVDIVPGQCRVETEDDGERLRIRMEPAGLKLGLNVLQDGERRLRVYRVDQALHDIGQVLDQPVEVPRDQVDPALGILGRLAERVEVHSPHLGADRDQPADAVPCLRIVPNAGAWTVQLGVRPFGGRGRYFLPASGPRGVSLYTRSGRLRSARDFAQEKARASLVILSCPTLVSHMEQDAEALARWDSERSWDLGEEELLGLLWELRGAPRVEVEWPESDALRLRGGVGARSIHGSLRRKKAWYLATGTVSLEDESELQLTELLSAVPIGTGRFVRLPNGDFVQLEERVRKLTEALRAVQPSGASGELKVHAALLSPLAALAEFGEGISVDTESQEWLAQVSELRDKSFPVPEALHATLRGYQIEGYRWLRSLAMLGLGACLADDMGLGKTIQILAYLLADKGNGPALIVAPTSVCPNWIAEMKRFAPSLTFQEYGDDVRLSQAQPQLTPWPDVVVMSYGLLQQDIEWLQQVPFRTVVLDEAQFIKNPSALRSRAAHCLLASFRIAATGTPVENHLGDLWSVFHFLNPGMLGSRRSFNQRFAKAIERDGDESKRSLLQRQVQPYILRRTKQQVLSDLPALTVVQHSVEFTEAEREHYALLRRKVRDKLQSAQARRGNKLEILAEITRLRRFCCHPSLVFPEYEGETAKLAEFLNLVEELRENGHRALVFSQFVDFLRIVRERLEEAQITYQYLDGATPRAERGRRVEEFQEGKGELFLVSLKAGGFGLNLTAADYVIHLDPWWNPAAESQATDRAHRIGQKRPVTVYRLVTKESIEQSIVALHADKRALADSLLEGGSLGSQLEPAQLIELIEGRALPQL